MHLDVLDLRQFYYRTRLGRAAQKAVRDRLMAMWPEAKGQTVAGFGFAVPLLRPYLADARPTAFWRVVTTKFKRLMVPAWLFGTPYFFMFYEPNLEQFVTLVSRGIGHLWFLPSWKAWFLKAEAPH